MLLLLRCWTLNTIACLIKTWEAGQPMNESVGIIVLNECASRVYTDSKCFSDGPISRVTVGSGSSDFGLFMSFKTSENTIQNPPPFTSMEREWGGSPPLSSWGYKYRRASAGQHTPLQQLRRPSSDRVAL